MIGVPQVCTITKMVNAVWIDALDQPCAACISGTNRVHEYWKFDAATMQPTPTKSCIHRFTSPAGADPSDRSFFIRCSSEAALSRSLLCADFLHAGGP